MTQQLCPCSELDWREVDMTSLHHPDCKAQATVNVTVTVHGSLVDESQLRNVIRNAVWKSKRFSTPGTAAVSDRHIKTNMEYIIQPFEVTTYPAPIDCSAVRHTLDHATPNVATTLCAGCVCPNCNGEYEANVTIPFFQQWAEFSCPYCKQRIMWFADEQAIENYRRLFTND